MPAGGVLLTDVERGRAGAQGGPVATNGAKRDCSAVCAAHREALRLAGKRAEPEVDWRSAHGRPD
jgi:hypothetical protein